MSIDFNRLKIGDRLVRTKGGILSKHHAIYAGYWYNQHFVAENQINFGVRYITLNQFLSEGRLERIEYYNYSIASQSKIIERINKKVGTMYSLFTYNCEHFVNEILTDIAESRQIKNGITLGVGISLFLLMVGGNKTRT